MTLQEKLRLQKTTAQCLLLAAFACFAVNSSLAQESSSKPAAGAVAPSRAPAAPSTGPIAALRDALSAACSQSENDFAHFLTTRNAQSFGHLTPAARVALMKRFVLLNEPGKPSVEVNPSGRPTIHCDTPAGAADVQIGGAEVSDNLAFMPVEIRDATDTAGSDVMHVRMGLVRENGQWKLLSVGLVLLDLPSLSFEWDAAEIDSTERAAIDSIKQIADAAEAYRRKYFRLPESLDKLAPPPRGAAPGAEAAGLLEPDLAAGKKNGYEFRYVIVGASTLGAPAKFELAATPLTYGRTGRRSFFLDASGGLHGADRQGAVGSGSDPAIK